MKPNRIQISPKVYLDLTTHELVFNRNEYEERSRLEPLTVELLKALAKENSGVVTREQLVDEVWEGNAGVGNKALTKNIYKLRKILGGYGMENLIETIPKKGYRLSISQPVKRSRSVTFKPWMVAAGIIAGLVVIKLLVPGLFHGFSHGLMH